MRSYEDSLHRLGRDRIDILFLHDIGTFTHANFAEEHRHFKDAMTRGYRALDELGQSGDVKVIGIGVNEIDVSLRSLDHGDWDIFLLAGRYTLLEQPALDKLLPKCELNSVKVIIGAPFNSGILVGGSTWNYEKAPVAVTQRVELLKIICHQHKVPLPTAALKFPLAYPAIASVIPGSCTPQEFNQLLDWWNTNITLEFWGDLKSQGLICPNAPMPVT
jgi:D-threo-aldose 1-dehydrogenase